MSGVFWDESIKLWRGVAGADKAEDVASWADAVRKYLVHYGDRDHGLYPDGVKEIAVSARFLRVLLGRSSFPHGFYYDPRLGLYFDNRRLVAAPDMP